MKTEEQEIKETIELLRKKPNNPILMELEDGEYILSPRKIFDDLVSEVNASRIKNMGETGEATLITIGEES